MPAEALQRSAVTAFEPGAPAPPAERVQRRGGGGPELFGDPDRFGLLAFLGTVTMMFVGFTSAYVVRRAAADWRPLDVPSLMWLNTAVLLVSSAALERSRRFLRAEDAADTLRWLAATGALGVAFVVGQFQAWRGLQAQGLFLASNPHSSFLYLLSGLHIVHLAGGLVWFGVVLRRGQRLSSDPARDGLRLFAIYWHFLGALWAYLFVLLFFL